MATNPTPLELAGAEAVEELANALLVAAGQVMLRHGDDPCSGSILGSGFGLALRRIGREIDPGVPDRVRRLLERSLV